MFERSLLRVKADRGVATVEYIVLIIVLALAIPFIAMQIGPGITARFCAASESLGGGACTTPGLSVADVTVTTFKGVPVEIDLLAGAAFSAARLELFSFDRAFARTDEPRTGATEITITRIDPPMLGRVESPRALNLGSGRVEPIAGSDRILFDPISDFEPLRSDEFATVVFEFGVAGPEDTAASARVTVTVLGFHAEDDVVSATSDTPLEIDALANDHLIDQFPARRDEVRIVSVTQPTRGSVTIVDDRILYTPGTDFIDRTPGEVVTISFSYTVEHDSGAQAVGQVTLAVEVVSDTGPDIVQVAVGTAFRCARSRVGEIWCWGNANASGQLGRGFTGGSGLQTPRRVVHPLNEGEFLSGMVDVSLGENHACAVSQAGHVYCWGSNSHGQIGDGWVSGTANVLRPRRVIALDGQHLTGMGRLAVGARFSCAHAIGGLAYCWGWNLYGSLGRNESRAAGTVGSGDPADTHARAAPVSRLLEVRDLAAGQYHACALGRAPLPGFVDGHDGAWCWGWRGMGATGNGMAGALSWLSPVPVMQTGTAVNGHPNGENGVVWTAPVSRIFVGTDTSCFLSGATSGPGQLYCFGSNMFNRIFLGSGFNGSAAVPRAVVGLPAGDFASVAMGENYSCATHVNGSIWCAGSNQSRQIGPSSLGDFVTTPVDIASNMPAGGFGRIVAGSSGRATCGLNPHPQPGPALHCWGHVVVSPGNTGNPTEIVFE